MASVNETDSEDETSGERFWDRLSRQRYVPLFVKHRVVRRLNILWERQAVETSSRQDSYENAATRMPKGEHLRFPLIWVMEIYTPTTVAGLLEGLGKLLAKQQGLRRSDDDPVAWVRSSRQRSRGEFFTLHPVVAAGSTLGRPDPIIDNLPTGIEAVKIRLDTLTSAITVVTAAFRLTKSHAKMLEAIVEQNASSRAEPRHPGFHVVLGAREVKRSELNKWRNQLRKDCARWLGKRLPGSFHRLVPGQLPAIEFLITAQRLPWDPPGTYDWAELVGLAGSPGYWQCLQKEDLRLGARQSFSTESALPLMLTLAGKFPDIVDAHLGVAAGTQELLSSMLNWLEEQIPPLASRWALGALLGQLSEQLTGFQDIASQASGRKSPRALSRLQRQLVHTGLDSQIVASTIARYSDDGDAWMGFLDFSEVPADGGVKKQPPPQFLHTLRADQSRVGRRVAQAERDLREVLDVSAQLSAAASNLQLQWLVAIVAVISLIVAGVAAWATVIALHGNSPAPSPRPSVSSSASPRGHKA